MAHYLVVDGLAGQHQLVSDAVGLDEARAEGDQHLTDHRFAGCDASGEADFQHTQWPVLSGRWSVRAVCMRSLWSPQEFFNARPKPNEGRLAPDHWPLTTVLYASSRLSRCYTSAWRWSGGLRRLGPE